MTLEILTPDNTVYQGEVNSVTLPGSLGSFEVLKDHAPIISTLDDGKVIIRTGAKSEQIFFITAGVVEVLNNKITVLAEGVSDK